MFIISLYICEYPINHHVVGVHLYKFFICLDINETSLNQATMGYNNITSYYKSSSVCLFVCLSVCSLSPPRSFDRSSPNLVGVSRWTSELPLRGSFSKRSTARRVNGSLSLSTILYMHQPHATRCNGSSCLQLQSLIRHLLLDGYRTASQQCI